MRPSQSRISPARYRPGILRDCIVRIIDLAQRHAAGGDLGVVPAAMLHDRKDQRRQAREPTRGAHRATVGRAAVSASMPTCAKQRTPRRARAALAMRCVSIDARGRDAADSISHCSTRLETFAREQVALHRRLLAGLLRDRPMPAGVHHDGAADAEMRPEQAAGAMVDALAGDESRTARPPATMPDSSA